MYDYEEACPISKASSVLCERWTLQILREMFLGVSRFTEFQRYLPKISPSLLKTRLQTLEESNIIVRKRIPEKKGYEYCLTPSGQALKPLLTEIGKWGTKHSFGDINKKEVNTIAIVRDFAVALNLEELPTGDLTFAFMIDDEDQKQKIFIMVRKGCAQVCDENFGTEVDLYLTASSEVFANIWYGRKNIRAAVKNSEVKLIGNIGLERSIEKWLGVSQFAQ